MALSDGLIASYSLQSGGAPRSVGPTLSLNDTPTFSAGKLSNGMNTGGQGGAGATAAAFATDAVFDLTAGSRSFGLWVKAAVRSGQPGIASVWASGGATQWLLWLFSDSIIRMQIRKAGGGDVTADSTFTPADSVYFCVVVRWNTTTNHFDISVNGETPVDADLADEPAAGDPVFTLASRNGFTAVLAGQVDEFNVWDRVITTAEIAEFYNAGAGVEGPFTPATPPSQLP